MWSPEPAIAGSSQRNQSLPGGLPRWSEAAESPPTRRVGSSDPSESVGSRRDRGGPGGTMGNERGRNSHLLTSTELYEPVERGSQDSALELPAVETGDLAVPWGP